MSTTNHSDGLILDTLVAAATSSGDVIALAPYGIRIALNDIASGATGPAYASGVHTLAAKESDVWGDNDPLYWDTVEKELTDTVKDTFAGFAVGAKAGSTATAKVRLEWANLGATTTV